MKKIRTELMHDLDEPLSGDVEIDETSWGGKPRGPKMDTAEAAAWREAKPTVLGGILRQPQDGDARRLQQGLAGLLTVVP